MTPTDATLVFNHVRVLRCRAMLMSSYTTLETKVDYYDVLTSNLSVIKIYNLLACKNSFKEIHFFQTGLNKTVASKLAFA